MYKKIITILLIGVILFSCSKDPIDIVHFKFISLDSKGDPYALYKVSNFVDDDRFDYQILQKITKLNSPFELDGKQYFNYGFFEEYRHNPPTSVRYIEEINGKYYLSNIHGISGSEVFPVVISSDFDNLSDICILLPTLCQKHPRS